MRILLTSTLLVLAISCGPTCAAEADASAATNDPATAAIAVRLDSIIIDRFGVPAGPTDAADIRRQLAYLSSRSQQLDPAHRGLTFRLRESPIDPKPPAAPPTGNPGYRAMQSWEYVPLRVLLDYICRANGLSYDVENGEVILFRPMPKAIVL